MLGLGRHTKAVGGCGNGLRHAFRQWGDPGGNP
jgi:hypothetical protein